MAARFEAKTLGELKRTGYESVAVKDEIRRNLIRKLTAGEQLFPGVLGYDRTVIPQIQNALLARHDILLLGLRGQAKSRIVRALPGLLDEVVPAIEAAGLYEDPLRPITRQVREMIEEMGDETPIRWIPREERYAEKLATPDTSIADLIGDIDPIKAATQRLTYADEEVIHFGLIPRTHRGIFALNELPDLAPRIQVGLLNIMEEQDVQIRGFNLRLPIDLLMVYTANPEDYTNRGTIITPLKDRIDSQILTHYPSTIDVAMAITEQEAWQTRGEVTVHVPPFMREIVEQVAFEARSSEYVDQQSGVSARLTRAALEALISGAERRAILQGQSEVHARISDLEAIEPAVTGKVELVYEGEQEGPRAVARLLVGRAVGAVFRKQFPDPTNKDQARAAYGSILTWFAKGNDVELNPDLNDELYRSRLAAVDGLDEVVKQRGVKAGEDDAVLMEFVLEGLHQHSLIGKDAIEEQARYSDMMGQVLGTIGRFDDDLDDDDEDWDSYRQSG